MTTMTFKTLKGAEMSLSTGYGVTMSVTIKGTVHTFGQCELKHTAALGWYVDGGPAKAQIAPDYLAAVEALFADEKRQHDARIAEYLASDEHKADKRREAMNRRMYSAKSDC